MFIFTIMKWNATVRNRFNSKIDFEIGISIQCFDDVHNKLVSAHCTVTLNALTGLMKIINDVYFQTCQPVNVPRSKQIIMHRILCHC